MDWLQITNTLLGGIGLFLVGMWLMSDGLRFAAGNALRDILFNWTNTRLRGLLSGFMITGLVQASGAVTVATIGFANAGLLSLQQAVWVIFGSNVGTTMTGWIVALIGFKVDMDYLALPLVGLGMLLRLTGSKSRRAAIGQAVVGFGLFFLGISVLKEGFTLYAADVSLPPMADSFVLMLLTYILLGVVLTTLMQSSSAAIIITLGAAAGGAIPLGSAAAVVIGANLGTTTTAVIAVWGATATAKRVATSHVLFNLITAAIAIIILLPMLSFVAWVQRLLQISGDIATTLALFHTAFNVLGVIIMWPLAKRMTDMLEGWYVSEQETVGRPLYLDKTSLEIPAVAVEALLKEMDRIGSGAASSVRTSLGDTGAGAEAGQPDAAAAEVLASAVGDYVSQLSRRDLPEKIASSLPLLLQITQQYLHQYDLATDVAALQGELQHGDPAIQERIHAFKERINAIYAGGEMTDLETRLAEVESEYDSLKQDILNAASRGRMGMPAVDAQLQQNNLMRRMARQQLKVARRREELQQLLQPASRETTDETGAVPPAHTEGQ